MSFHQNEGEENKVVPPLKMKFYNEPIEQRKVQIKNYATAAVTAQTSYKSAMMDHISRSAQARQRAFSQTPTL